MPSDPVNKRVKTRRGVKWLTVSVAAFVLCIVLVFGLAQTNAAKRQIARLIAAGLSEPGKLEWELGELGGVVPFSVDLDHLTLSDGDGQWLRIEAIALTWSPLALLKGNILVRQLTAGVVELMRLPASSAEVEASGQDTLTWPAALKRFGLNRLAVEELRLGAEVLGMKARFGLEASVEARRHAGSLTASLEGRTQVLDSMSPVLDALLGRDIRYAADLELTERKVWMVEEFAIQGKTTSLTGAASIDLVNKRLEGACHLDMPELSAAAEGSPGFALGGAFQVEGKVEGTLDNLRLKVEARARDLVFDQFEFQEVSASVGAKGGLSRASGVMGLEVRQETARLDASTDFALEGPLLTFSNLSVETGLNTLKGALALELDRFLVEGRLQGGCDRLSDLGAFVGKEISGKAEVGLQFASAGSGQQVIFELLGKDLTNGFGRVGSLALKGELSHPLESPQGKAECTLNHFSGQGLILDSLNLSAKGNAEEMELSGSAQGHYGHTFEMEGSAAYRAPPQGRHLEISQLHGQFANLPLTLLSPATLHITSTGPILEPFYLDLGGGRLEGSANLQDAGFTVEAVIEKLPLAALDLAEVPALDGTLTGSLHFHGGPDKEPEGSVLFQVDELVLSNPQFQGLPPAKLAAHGELKGGRLGSELTLRSATGPSLDAALNLPLDISFAPFAWSVPGKGGLYGHLSGKMQLAWLPLFFMWDDHSMEGLLEMSLHLEGTTQAPEIIGRGIVSKGVYEHYQTGMLFKDVALAVAARPPRLTVETARAADGKGGVVSAQGWMDLLPDKGFPFTVQLTLDQATLVRLDHATAVASGALTYSGTPDRQLLAGHLQVKEAELSIPNRLPPEMTELEVVEIHGPEEEPRSEPNRSTSEESSLTLDVAVSGAGRIFLRGRGLDSEWQGNLKIKGTAKEPVMHGRLAVVRGHFDFLGRRFGLTRGGLTLDGSVPPAPYLDVLGEARAEEVTAKLHVSGFASAPDVILGSDPEMPSEEILSRMLFGRSVSSITSVQGVRLALAARTLAGEGGGFDVMGNIREVLGVDQLEVRQTGQDIEETTISAGKYLKDGVYLELEKGTGPETGKTSMEIEVTPNITLETEIGENAEGGIGINWKKNY
jgi:translocation and assembly module TamB